ncbi:MAG: uracil-DNA glycosylase [Acidobacteria bacterium]|nr:uracil-DNA glycosylase [Acidobacteriota bacterium]
MKDSLISIQQQVISCTRCPRLVEYRERVAREKRRAYREWEYWGRPVPGFGDPKARLLIVGLAPAAHGGNRTGRVFTGDRSGDFLYSALYRAGFANQPTSVSRDDGLKLRDAYVTAAVRCAPPDNKPLPEEFRNCREYLIREMNVLRQVRVIVALGRHAFDSCLTIFKHQGAAVRLSQFQFAHAAAYHIPEFPTLIASYHPSQQNTQTGKLTAQMFDQVFRKAKEVLSEPRA